MKNKESEKQEKTLHYGYFTCIVACVHIFLVSLFLDNSKWAVSIPLTALCILLGLWSLYNYKKLAMWHNKRHARLHVKDGVAGEPSQWLLLRVRIEGWTLIALGFLLPLLTSSYLFL